MSQIGDAVDGVFDRKALLDALDELVELLGRIPGAARYLEEVHKLKAILLEKRPPRIAVVGRRGAGKSSIANAILGADTLVTGPLDVPASDEWRLLEVGGRSLHWLDTSGIGAGGIAEERLEHLKKQVADQAPDTIIFACKAKEADAEIDHTLEQFKSIVSVLGSGDTAAKVIVALTQCDELKPERSKDVPYPDSKLEVIGIVTKRLEEHLARHGVARYAVVPVSTLMEFDELGAMTWDGRFNVRRLEQVIFEVMPLNAQLEAARLFERFRGARRELAVKIVRLCSSVSFGIGALPIPASDILPLYSLQATMVTAIAYLSGRKLSPKAVAEWIGALGLGAGIGVGLREIFRQLVKGIPVGGSVASGGIAAAGTYSLGMSSVVFFLDGKSTAEAKSVYQAETSRSWHDADDAPPNV